MLRDPYRQMFLAGNAVSRPLSGPSGLDSDGELLMGRLEIAAGSRVLLAGLAAPEILPCLRLKLGLTGQLVILDPDAGRLAEVPRRDADWAVMLKAPATAIPNMDSSLDCVLCWQSFLDLDRHYLQVADEFFRVLAPGGRAIICQSGPLAPDGPPRPCPAGLAKLLIRAGFGRMSHEETAETFLFRAEKVAGFDQGLARTGWA